MSPIKIDMEKFDGMINFNLWQVQIKDMLIQSALHKDLEGRLITDVPKELNSVVDQ